jgi:hypothetical protein
MSAETHIYNAGKSFQNPLQPNDPRAEPELWFAPTCIISMNGLMANGSRKLLGALSL